MWVLLTWSPGVQWNVGSSDWGTTAGTAWGWTWTQKLVPHQVLRTCVFFLQCWWGSLLWRGVLPHPAQWSVSYAILVAPQSSLILSFAQWIISLWEGQLQRVETTRNLQWRLSVGKYLLVSRSSPKTLYPFIISLGKIGWKTQLKYFKNTKQKGFLLKFLAGVRQGHIKPWIYFCKDPIISGI